MSSRRTGNPAAMARTDDDSWDITEGVGQTALGVAMARAEETTSERPLFSDPYARLFLDAATERGWRKPPPYMVERFRSIGGYAASRTKWFDEFFIAAGANGIEQAVILAAGLDARAWRLPWVHGSTVYEIDQPKVRTNAGVDALVLRLEGELASVAIEGRARGRRRSANAVAPPPGPKRGLAGFEFACAIPGTTGGGVWMNGAPTAATASDPARARRDPDGDRLADPRGVGLAYRHSDLRQGRSSRRWSSR